MPDALSALYVLPARIVEDRGAIPGAWTVLSAAAADHAVRRPSEDTLELTTLGGHLWEQPFERLFLPIEVRGQPGDSFQHGPLRARILESDARGPMRVAFTFDPPLDDPGWRFLAWQDGALRAVALPAVGAERTIPWIPSPLPTAL